ncbi:MAG: VWA domain-containing protein [Planctomycetaceae bacterium]|nr:VWA domain-containing protein [Planctomycetaceae bacterium]
MRWYVIAVLVGCVAVIGCGRAADTSRQLLPPAASAAADAEGEGLLPIQIVGPEVEFNTEAYDRIYENPFLVTRDHPLSTFSIDVDTASYSNVRRFLENGQLPPPDAVRIEELVNHFDYRYEPPKDETPFSAQVEVASCPWNPKHRLARIGLKGKEIPEQERPEANLVFLLDVSGSMDQPNKLPLLKSAMGMLVENLSDRDRVSIVVYAGAAGVVLPPTSCEERSTILAAMERLQAGGSTAGSEGIQLAYQVAQKNFNAESVNRVILCTDGDFNVGFTNQGDLIRLIEQKAKEGVFLTCLGFGMGNYKDSTLEKLADKGNGNYAYIDTIHEARKVLVEQLGGTLFTIAKDVKIQVDFNPAQVGAYRLIGYENRLLRDEDFRDDTKDAGEIGAGYTVTALYELIPAGQEADVLQAEPSKYQQTGQPTEAAASGELLTLRLRYKQPAGETSEQISFPVSDAGMSLEGASGDFRFAAAVAGFGMLLRNSEHRGEGTYDLVVELAQSGKGDDPHGYRAEFVKLVELAKAFQGRRG